VWPLPGEGGDHAEDSLGGVHGLPGQPAHHRRPKRGRHLVIEPVPGKRRVTQARAEEQHRLPDIGHRRLSRDRLRSRTACAGGEILQASSSASVAATTWLVEQIPHNRAVVASASSGYRSTRIIS
jgi:hypothetical protein